MLLFGHFDVYNGQPRQMWVFMLLLNIAIIEFPPPQSRYIMTLHQDEYHQQLEVSRNKVKMLINYHLNAITDALILNEEPVLPIPTRSGFLEYSKNPEKFGNLALVNF